MLTRIIRIGLSEKVAKNAVEDASKRGSFRWSSKKASLNEMKTGINLLPIPPSNKESYQFGATAWRGSMGELFRIHQD
jgi:hypothetical protein